MMLGTIGALDDTESNSARRTTLAPENYQEALS